MNHTFPTVKLSQYVAMLIQMLSFSMSALGQTFFDPHQAFELASQGKAVLIDVREADEVKLGMAKGALWFPLSRVQGHPQDLEKFLANLPKDKLSLVYCRSGRRAETFVKILRERGFSAENLGGFDAWVQAGLPVTNGSAMMTTKSDRIASIEKSASTPALEKQVKNTPPPGRLLSQSFCNSAANQRSISSTRLVPPRLVPAVSCERP